RELKIVRFDPGQGRLAEEGGGEICLHLRHRLGDALKRQRAILVLLQADIGEGLAMPGCVAAALLLPGNGAFQSIGGSPLDQQHAGLILLGVLGFAQCAILAAILGPAAAGPQTDAEKCQGKYAPHRASTLSPAVIAAAAKHRVSSMNLQACWDWPQMDQRCRDRDKGSTRAGGARPPARGTSRTTSPGR